MMAHPHAQARRTVNLKTLSTPLAVWTDADRTQWDTLPWTSVVSRLIALIRQTQPSPAATLAERQLRQLIQSAPGCTGELLVEISEYGADPKDLVRTQQQWNLVQPWYVLQAVLDTLHEKDDVPYSIYQKLSVLVKRMVWHTLSQNWDELERDPVTGVSNRRATQVELDRLHRLGQPFTVYYVDLNDFKLINDSYGHAVGDRVLRTVAERWQGLMRESDWCGRWGGDEFLIIVSGSLSEEAAMRLGVRLRQACAEPICLPPLDPIVVSTAYGYAHYPTDADTVEDLVDVADRRLYAAKGRKLHQQWGREVSSVEGPTLRVEGELDEARIDVHYQPIVEVSSGRVIHWEALVRYRGENDSLHYPTEFLKTLSPATLQQLNRWVLRRVFGDLNHWSNAGYHPTVAVNVDIALLATSPGLRYVTDLHRRYPGISPAQLAFDIRENWGLWGASSLVERLQAWREQGYGINLDNFGQARTALAELVQLPLTGVKIDRSVTGQWQSPAERRLLQSLLAMGLPLGLTMVAQGVESPDQYEALQAWGCQTVQGWLVGKAVPAQEVLMVGPRRQ
ncbi:MAG: hypothetical protein C7B45_05725 [Sulfobacillus acidophilus]|uniref:Diguanylate cyclase n=1 Tax=Sulfobacillus acidophilus TaxID=53633 RepID=A0A2T2WKB6_9FIRM|nr:MAG: hypothetical protein C7B45_05725 [Sulfobacillus acidophilus]